jgi:hypothetical protein
MYTIDLFSSYVLLSCVATLFFAAAIAFCVYQTPSSFRRLSTFVLWAALIIPFLLFIHAVERFGINVPYLDDYDAFLAYFLKPMSERINVLGACHNEHRILFVRLIAEGIYAVKGTLDFRWIIFIGNGFFLLLTALFLKELKKHSVFFWWSIPFSWAFLSILLFQNMLWAITAVQSNCVVLFAYLAFKGMEVNTPRTFLYALLSALLATYTSGAGMFVWPCLLVMLLKVSWVDHGTVGISKYMALLFIATVAIGLYFIGFSSASSSHISFTANFFMKVLLFAATFCGAALHFFLPSLLVGIAVMAFAVYLLFNLKRIRNNGILFFLLYLLMTAGTAALFRCEEFGVEGALGFRYRINSLCILFCCGLLAQELFVLPIRYCRHLCAMATFGFVALNLVAYLIAYPQLITRKENQLKGLSTWKTDPSGLVYHTNRLAYAQHLLEASKKSGTFDADTSR